VGRRPRLPRVPLPLEPGPAGPRTRSQRDGRREACPRRGRAERER
jgi:hypothetical protein